MRSLLPQLCTGVWLLCMLLLPQNGSAELKTYVHNATATHGGAISVDTARITAIVKAKQLAMELAGTYIDSLAVLDKGVVDKHEVRAIAAGTAGAEIIDERIDTDAITVTARIDVDTGMLTKRVERMLEDRSVLKRLQLLLHKEDRYLEQIQELEKENQGLIQKKAAPSQDLARKIETSANHLKRLQDSKSRLKSLLDKMDNPILLVAISEEYVGFDQPDLQSASTTINNALKSRGFQLVLPMGDGAPRVQALAKGAAYMLTGKTVVRDTGEIIPDTGMHSFQAVVRVSIIHTQTGSIIGATTGKAAAAHISPATGAGLAVEQATEKLIREYVVTTIKDSFRDYLLNGLPIEVVVTGVDGFKKYKQIRSMIDQLPEILDTKKRSWSKDEGRLILDIRSGLGVDKTAEILDQAKVSSGRLEVVDLGPGNLDLVFMSN
ncbi:cell division protein ZapB [Desulfoplanes sp.]